MLITSSQRIGRVCAVVCLLTLCVSAPAQTTTQVIAVSGDAAPDGNGTIGSIFLLGPAFNDAGQAVFFSALTGTSGGSSDDTGIFLGNGTTLSQIAREGQSVPNGNGSFANFLSSSKIPALNNAGQVAFLTSLTGTSGGSGDDTGIFRSDGTPAGLAQIVREGQAAPDGNGSFNFALFTPTLNDAGQVAFRGGFAGTVGAKLGIFRSDGATLTRIVRAGDPAITGGGFSGFSAVVTLNQNGQVAFSGRTDVFGAGKGIFHGNGITTPTQIVEKDDFALDGNGVFSQFLAPAFNDAQQTAFIAIFTGTSGGSSDNEGIFRGDGTPGTPGTPDTPGNLVRIVRKGQAAPDGNGTFDSFRWQAFSINPALNEAGQVAFFGAFVGTSGGSSDNAGIFRSDGLTLTQIVREGQASPDGNGTFSSLNMGEPAINDAGQVAFKSSLSGTSGATFDDTGIFLYDDILGLRLVVREGDALLGSTITDLSFSHSGVSNRAERGGLNNLGQVAYHFRLLDGRSGVASSGFTSLTGDLDGDGFVGIADLNIVLSNWNQNVPPANPLADPSGDGFVGIDDLNAVLGNWNAGTPPSVTANIPEPASLVCLGLSSLGLLTRRQGSSPIPA